MALVDKATDIVLDKIDKIQTKTSEIVSKAEKEEPKKYILKDDVSKPEEKK
jgi:hypothetical protein